MNNTNHEITDVLEVYPKSLIDNVQVFTVNSDNEISCEDDNGAQSVDDTDDGFPCYDMDKIIIGTSSLAQQAGDEEQKETEDFVDAQILQQQRLNRDSSESRYIDE